MIIAIVLVLATIVLLYIVVQTRQILTWILIAAFFAVAIYPAVGLVQRRVLGGRRRALATLLVFLLFVLVLAGIIAAFAVPTAQEGTRFAGQLPGLINEARAGHGPVGELLVRTHALQWAQDNQDKIRSFATGLTTPAAGVAKGIATGIAGALTVFVLAYLMVLQGPALVEGTVGLFEPRNAARIRRVGTDCARAITGYVSGNLLISVICGGLTYLVLRLTGVPFAALIALFVAIADLIPLVGATLGAIVACFAGFVHSIPAGIILVVFFVVYQQLENHLLQPMIFSRTVRLNPLTVLIAILIAAELAGILGALLAIPIAGMIQAIVQDIWKERRARLREEEFAVGEDLHPTTSPEAAIVDASAQSRDISDSVSRAGNRLSD
jgi:predicted PurR-regulated permease PerM